MEMLNSGFMDCTDEATMDWFNKDTIYGIEVRKNQGAVMVTMNSSNKFHEITCENGYVIGRFGAMGYLLSSDGSKVSKEFHEFSREKEQFIREVGATKSIMTLSGNPTTCVKPD